MTFAPQLHAGFVMSSIGFLPFQARTCKILPLHGHFRLEFPEFRLFVVFFDRLVGNC